MRATIYDESEGYETECETLAQINCAEAALALIDQNMSFCALYGYVTLDEVTYPYLRRQYADWRCWADPWRPAEATLFPWN